MFFLFRVHTASGNGFSLGGISNQGSGAAVAVAGYNAHCIQVTYFIPFQVVDCHCPSSGCTLPVEMFFPKEEYPIQAVEEELQHLGVICSVLPDLVPARAVRNSSNSLTDAEGKRLAGFSMKSALYIILLGAVMVFCSVLLWF